MRQMKAFATTAAILLGSLAVTTGPAAADRGGCPPGLQKKHNGCLPPGQAKKLYRRDDDRRHEYDRYREYDHHHWRHGDRIEHRDYIIIRDYDRYHLPRLRDGSVYVAVGGQLLRVDPDTLKVIGVVGLLSDLLR